MDSKDENIKGAEGDKSDANWFNFGNRESTQSSEYGVLYINEDSIEYDMKHRFWGKCIILNHEQFKDNVCEPRKGSTADATALFDCFTRIGFDVTLKNDLGCDQLFQYLYKDDHSNNDCFVCCILTHGQNECLWAYDQMYSVDNILSFFSGEKCKSLVGKPKIFVIQACRGCQFDEGTKLKVVEEVTDGRDSKIVKIPVFADFLMAYSTMSGYFSWRNPVKGSWFINHFTDVVNKYHDNYDLLSMLTIINQRIAYHNESRANNPNFDKKKQVPCITHTLTRKIFFKSKEISYL